VETTCKNSEIRSLIIPDGISPGLDEIALDIHPESEYEIENGGRPKRKA
ncbi:MAG: hypothetical protein RLZ76_675, partial [Bacteroidota bacterium]